MALTLERDEAHVWYAWTARCATPALLAWYRSLLSPQEHERCNRFAFDHLKAEYLLTRALCRVTLSRYADVAPADWIFRSNDYGRPEIAGPATPPPLRFNLSNARSLVACVVTRDADAGVDVEETDRAGGLLDIADRYFSPDELRDLQALPADQRGRRFFELWTLKESYIKARGLGLQIPLDQFSFHFDTAIRIAFSAPLEDSPENWQFFSTELGPAHRLALGLRRQNAADYRIQLREVVPGP